MQHPRRAFMFGLGIAAVTLVSIVPSQSAPAATPKAGQSCKTAGARVGNLVCTKVGTKLVYRVAPATTTTAPTKTAAPATTAAAAASAAPVTTAAAAKSATAIKATLGEWNILTQTLYKSGPVTFEVSNTGEFPHDFVVAQGISYNDLPKLAGGAVDETKVKILGRTARLQPKESAKLDLNLPPGGYVFYCSIIFGPTNHAERGQVLPVTVQ